MATAVLRGRPLIAVLSGVPLFVEAMTAAFEGIADVASISADDQHAQGLLRAYDPNAAIVEGCEPGLVDVGVPCVSVDLATQVVSLRRDGLWTAYEVELSPAAIRNVAVAALYGGEPE
ncbi:MAG TPA: hypothetical protein VGO31_03410 [Microbacteriaceae bacterium]|nr:hypothetical protein [Microbacteriaceae bacterium]